jgi:alpha-glucosidase
MRRLIAALAMLIAADAQAASVQNRPDGIELHSGPATLRVTALTDDVLRVQAVPDGALPPGEPWAVVPGRREHGVAVVPQASGFATRALRVSVDPATLRLRVSDTAGRVLAEDVAGGALAAPGGGFRICHASPADAHYYALGDKPGALDRRGRAFVNWNTDVYGWQESTDPLYKTVPFFIALRGGTAYGVFLDSTWRSTFDFALTRRDAVCFGAEGGAPDWYFIAGPAPKQVLANYTWLTGRMKLPPLWSLGFHQSRWSYPTAARVEQVVAAYRAARIPLDAVWLDIGYQDRNRPFTIDAGAFPDLPGMIRRLRAAGVRVVAIADMHIADVPDAGYAPYDSGMAGGHFVRMPDGTPYVGRVWPGPALFPDFARAATRQWFGTLYRTLYLDAGIAGFWDDMNEPVVFDGPGKTLPLDAVHHIEQPGAPPRVATHREVHNAYGMLNAEATADGLHALAPDRRSFVLTRATFAGGQRSSAVWTGDNSATWNHWRISTPQLLNLGLSGFAFAGDDIGGFRGSASPELLTRWIELGAFNPFFRDHAEKHNADQEAYVGDAAQVARRRAAIAERYRLMPYLYAAAEEAARTGVPIMRPLFLEFPDAGMPEVGSQFLFGRALLVAPPPDERPDAYALTRPPGTAWFDYWTGRRVPDGAVELTPGSARLPVFARAGAIIPRAPLTQSTAETPQGNLELLVYPGPDCHGTIYADDGVSVAYTRGDFLRQEVFCRMAPDGLHVRIAPRQGSHAPWWREIDLVAFGQAAPAADGAPPGARFDPADGSLRLTLPDAPSGAEVVLGRGP